MASMLEHPQGLELSMLISSLLEAESTQIPQLKSRMALALPATAGAERVAGCVQPQPWCGVSHWGSNGGGDGIGKARQRGRSSRGLPA